MGGGPNNNVDRLDADGDGRACETLPCPCAGDGQPDRPQRIRARVTKVTDGDTLDVRAFGARRRFYTVRLIGIDTPEKYGQRECGAGRASRSMGRLAPVGARVTLVTDPSQPLYDRYDRLLAYVIRKRPRRRPRADQRRLGPRLHRRQPLPPPALLPARPARRPQRPARRLEDLRRPFLSPRAGASLLRG